MVTTIVKKRIVMHCHDIYIADKFYYLSMEPIFYETQSERDKRLTDKAYEQYKTN